MPACSAIVKKSIAKISGIQSFKKIFISVKDENKIASGGAEFLKKQGIEVEFDILKEEGKNETVIGQLYDGDPDMYSTGDERYKIFYMKIGKNYTLTLEPSGNYEKQIFNLYTTPSGAKYIFKVEN